MNIKLFLKGMAMGLADLVPGVSGGTIAFVTGIYEKLIESLSRFGWPLVEMFKQGGVKAVWQHVNGNFLLVLFAGVLTSIGLFATLIKYILEFHPILIWSFFFGLILASAYYISRQMPHWKVSEWVALAVGIFFAAGLSSMPSLTWPQGEFGFFTAGAIAICAMILPGVSGSFILLMLGMYELVLASIKGLDIYHLGLFAAGCVVGLLSFVRVIDWLLKHYHSQTLATLIGFMLGALVKVWPWKWVDVESGIVANVSPGQFELLSQNNSQVMAAVVLMVVGGVLVLGLECLGVKTSKNTQND